MFKIITLNAFFFNRLLMDKNIENQSFESVSNVVQKKFSRNDFLSGK